MKISYKKISTFIFALAFFLQSFGDGYYIAHGLEPSILKVAKYGLFVLGIVWGTYSTSGKDFHCYQKETFRILIAQFAIFIISLTLAIINNGNISNIFDQVFRYCLHWRLAFGKGNWYFYYGKFQLRFFFWFFIPFWIKLFCSALH